MKGKRWKVGVIRIQTPRTLDLRCQCSDHWALTTHWATTSPYNLFICCTDGTEYTKSYTWQDGVSQSFHIYILHKYVFKWHNWQLSSVCLQSSIRVQPENALLHKRWVVSLISNGLEHRHVCCYEVKDKKVKSWQSTEIELRALGLSCMCSDNWVMTTGQPPAFTIPSPYTAQVVPISSITHLAPT